MPQPKPERISMKISGYSFVKNGASLYYPVAESILSVLPICDEFFVAVGKGSEGDRTREVIAAIDNPKVKIIDTEWDEAHFVRGAVNSIQSDIARSHCTGDWLIYVQADEVIHERFLPVIKKRCAELQHDAEIEGLLLGYKHFWGDYSRYLDSHAWYAQEIRVTKNLPQIHSWHSAQSFRWYDNYDHPWQEHSTRKLRVVKIDAEVYHYGWVRPPEVMQKKRKALISVHNGIEKTAAEFEDKPLTFDYGDIKSLPRFKDSHPAVMQERIAQMNWQKALELSGQSAQLDRPPFKHEMLKYRVITAIEKSLLGGRPLFGRKNWEQLSR